VTLPRSYFVYSVVGSLDTCYSAVLHYLMPRFPTSSYSSLVTIALLQYQLPEVIYALTIKLEPKGGLFRSAFSFCYIVRITRFPRESLADLCLFDLKRSQVDHLRLISSRPNCWTVRLVPYHFTQPPNRWRCYEIFSWNLRFNHAVSCIYTRLIQKPTTRNVPFQPS